jgi:hypothetical protein
MKSRFIRPTLLLCGLTCAVPSFSQDANGPKIEPFVKAALVEGQFVNSHYTYNATSYYSRKTMPFRPWINNQYAQVGVKATLNGHFCIVISPEVRLWNDTWDWSVMGNNGAPNPFSQHVTVSLADAEGIITYGMTNALSSTVAFGVMPYKYNTDVKNLGEYLFRSGTHPAYIRNAFDYPYATVTGMRLNTSLMDRLSLDVLLTQETQVMPLNDWSVSVVAGYKLPKVLDIGAGVMFDRLIEAAGPLHKPGMTSPGMQGTFYTGSGSLDTLEFGGTKVMARLSFDPKGILPSGLAGIFGKEDCRLYAEAAALGVKSISAYKGSVNGADTAYVIDSMMNFYSDITQRAPVMIGFNVPVFKLLDYLSVEVERYAWPYSPSLYDQLNLNWALPRPIVPRENSVSRLYTKTNKWKFSVNARKTLWGSFAIIGQIARDHTRHDAYYSAFADPEEAFLSPGDWGWWLKLQYSL